jgi:hypothetical protein
MFGGTLAFGQLRTRPIVAVLQISHWMESGKVPTATLTNVACNVRLNCVVCNIRIERLKHKKCVRFFHRDRRPTHSITKGKMYNKVCLSGLLLILAEKFVMREKYYVMISITDLLWRKIL